MKLALLTPAPGARARHASVNAKQATKKLGQPSFDDVLGLAHAGVVSGLTLLLPTPAAAPLKHAPHQPPGGDARHSASPSKHVRVLVPQPASLVSEMKPPVSPGAFQAQLSQVTSGALADLPPPAPTRPNAEMLELSMADPSLRITGNAEVMHINLQTATSGPLELEVRVNHGRADVRIDGAGPLFAERAPELERVLASEGVSLGTYTTSQDQQPPKGDGYHFEAPPENPPLRFATPASVTKPSQPARHEGRIDVEA